MGKFRVQVISSLFSLLLIGIALSGTSQTVDQATVRKELADRKIDEKELRERLEVKGIDMENLNRLSPSEAIAVQAEIEATLAEMEEEKRIARIESDNSRSADPKTRDTDTIPQPLSNTNRSDTDSSRAEDYLQVEIYGQHIFKNRSIGVYNTTVGAKPPSTYVLGVGDEIVVSIWGLSRYEEALRIGEGGYVAPSRMPRIFLKGFTVKQAEEILRDSYARFYRFRRSEFEMVINDARIVRINIFGEVENYGGFTLPASNTVFNALVAAGGPTNIGSVRNIKLRRGDKIIPIDVYAYMSDPSLASDYFLRDNDIIQVPVAGETVVVNGEVNRPFKYEIQKGETLKDVLVFAGGLTDEALRSRIRVVRFEGDRRVELEIDDVSGDTFEVRGGDIITVLAISVDEKNIVTISGEVDYPGEYARIEGMQLSDLLNKAGITEGSRLDLGFLNRKNPDGTINLTRINPQSILDGQTDEVLQDDDEIVIYAKARYADTLSFVVDGAVREPGSFIFDRSGSVSLFDAVVLAGGLRADAEDFGYIYRKDSLGSNQLQYIRVDVKEAILNPGSDLNVVLTPNDRLMVGSKTEFLESSYIEVKGAVRKPGQYEYGERMKLSDALSLAGGFTFAAATNRIDLFRVEMKDNEATRTVVATVEVDRDLNVITEGGNRELQPFDQIVVREVPEFEFQQNVSLEGEVKYPGPYALTSDNERLSSVIKRAGGLTTEAFPEGATLFRPWDSIGYVVIDLKAAIAKEDARSNIILKDGDIISVPKRQDLVRIIGYTNAADLYPDRILSEDNGIAVPFYKGKNARYYVDEFAAGISETGDACEITVEHANGQVQHTKNYGLFRSYPKVRPGSIIKVGRKKTKVDQSTGEPKEDVDWGKIFANSIAQATTILSLILLIQRID